MDNIIITPTQVEKDVEVAHLQVHKELETGKRGIAQHLLIAIHTLLHSKFAAELLSVIKGVITGAITVLSSVVEAKVREAALAL